MTLTYPTPQTVLLTPTDFSDPMHRLAVTDGDVQYHRLTARRNCCCVADYKIRPLYNIQLQAVTGTGVDNGDGTFTTTFRITSASLNSDFITSICMLPAGDVCYYETNEFPFTYTPDTIGGSVIYAGNQIRVTTIDGFVYDVHFNLAGIGTPGNYTNPNGWNPVSEVTTVVTQIPQELTVGVGDTITLYSYSLAQSVYPETLDILDGVYGFSFTTAESNSFDSTSASSFLLNGKLNCRIIKFLEGEINFDLLMFYEALILAEDCDDVTEKQRCDLYNSIIRILLTKQKEGCGCGCS